MFLGRDVSEQRATIPADHRRADAAGGVVVTQFNLGKTFQIQLALNFRELCQSLIIETALALNQNSVQPLIRFNAKTRRRKEFNGRSYVCASKVSTKTTRPPRQELQTQPHRWKQGGGLSAIRFCPRKDAKAPQRKRRQ